MKELRSLNIGGTLVKDLSPLSNLVYLENISMVALKNLDLEPLAKLSSLTELNLTCSSVSNWSPLRYLVGLEKLWLNESNVVSLEPLGDLRNLRVVDLSHTAVSDIEHLAHCHALEKVVLLKTEVKDVYPLAALELLQEVDLRWCGRIESMECLRAMSNLKRLHIRGCCKVTIDWVISFKSLVYLAADNVVGVPPEVLTQDNYSNCLNEFYSWLIDLSRGMHVDFELKVFVLGNGTVGKTQICRQLRGDVYNDSVPSTHGVQIGIVELMSNNIGGSINAKIWDFGGQDIYHGTHALFLEGRAVFILVWTPALEGKGVYEEGGLSMHHHGLVYWLDYVRSMAGDNASLIVVQSKCDEERDRSSAPMANYSGFRRQPPQIACSAKSGEMGELTAALRAATRYLLEIYGSYRLPESWVAVRSRLRELKVTEKTLSRSRFDILCREVHGTSNSEAVLNYLHRSGEFFYREGLFLDEIVLDQEWAVRAIYAVLDRKGPCQILHEMGGVFNLPQLDSFAWHDQFTHDEQQTILGMMESCAICFPLDTRRYGGIKHRLRLYALPDFLPLEKDVTARVEALWRPDLPIQKVMLEYAFLHEGILRQFLCQIGTLGGADAAYWRYGCCFYDAASRSRARIRAENLSSAETPAKGCITIETCDGQAAELLARLLKAVQAIRIGQPPQVVAEEARAGASVAVRKEAKSLAESLKITAAPTAKPLVYLSYAWGGHKEEMVDRLEQRLIDHGYEVKRDKRSMRPGDWISDFMREIGQAERVCVVLSKEYVQSAYCMRELLYLYQTSCGAKCDFLNRIVPLVLEDARLTKTTDRMGHVRYWNQQLQELKDATTDIEPSMLGGAGADMAMIQEFCHSIELMLRHVSDYLMPRGIKEIEKDNFAALLEALKAKLIAE
jgi:internalin A